MTLQKQVVAILILISGFFATTAEAQQRVVLQGGGKMTTFNTANSFRDAYDAASDGDTIYLPGIEYSPPTTFNKKLVVYGTGHHPAATEAKGQTIVNGLSLGSGAAGSHFEGFRVNGNVIFASNTKIDNVTLKRLYITGYISIPGTNPDNNSDNITIRECISGEVNGQNTKNLKIFNCFVGRIINLSNNGWVSNSISIYGGHNFTNVHQSNIENNIVITTISSGSYQGVTNSTGNYFSNNVFSKNPTGMDDNTWVNNHINVDPGTLFVSYYSHFSYDADYNLVNPGAYQGTTGNQVGLYGGLSPAKATSIPVVPHIIEHTIATSVNERGEIEVSITVEAQEY
jgi:hypothetical protein